MTKSYRQEKSDRLTSLFAIFALRGADFLDHGRPIDQLIYGELFSSEIAHQRDSVTRGRKAAGSYHGLAQEHQELDRGKKL